MVLHSYANSSAQWSVAATLDSAHAERTFLLLRKVLTVALWSEGRNSSDKKKAFGKGHRCSLIETNRHATVGRSVSQKLYPGPEDGARNPTPSN